MKRYIDANIAKKLIAEKAREPDYQHAGENWRCGLCMAVDSIEGVPTADVVEVVRCKDCKHYKPYAKPVEDFDGNCIVRECETDENEFCSYGERRDI